MYDFPWFHHMITHFHMIRIVFSMNRLFVSHITVSLLVRFTFELNGTIWFDSISFDLVNFSFSKSTIAFNFTANPQFDHYQFYFPFNRISCRQLNFVENLKIFTFVLHSFYFDDLLNDCEVNGFAAIFRKRNRLYCDLVFRVSWSFIGIFS